jgi:hypothetical protein|tara:strand:+ start:113 stop:451 length:339 start_codon:yes stop_codon:yes gene_type:complete
MKEKKGCVFNKLLLVRVFCPARLFSCLVAFHMWVGSGNGASPFFFPTGAGASRIMAMKSTVMLSQGGQGIPWQGTGSYDEYESDGGGVEFLCMFAVIAFFSWLGWLNRTKRG